VKFASRLRVNETEGDRDTETETAQCQNADCTRSICPRLLRGYCCSARPDRFFTIREYLNFKNLFRNFFFYLLNTDGPPCASIRCRFFAQSQPWLPVVHGVVTFFVVANFTLATFMDPGVIPKGKRGLCLL